MVEENRYLEEKDNIRQRSTDRYIWGLCSSERSLVNSLRHNYVILLCFRRAERKAKHDEIRRKYGKCSLYFVYKRYWIATMDWYGWTWTPELY